MRKEGEGGEVGREEEYVRVDTKRSREREGDRMAGR